MEKLKQTVSNSISIHPKYCTSSLLQDVVECFISEKWLRSVKKDQKFFKPPTHPSLSPDEVQSSLQLRESIGELWQRVLIQVLHKKHYEVFTLPRLSNTVKSHLANNLTYTQLLHYVSASNIKNLWKDSYQRFEDHAVIKQWKESQRASTDTQSNVLKAALLRLYKCPIIPLNDEIQVESRTSSVGGSDDSPEFGNIHQAEFIVEAPSYFFVFLEPCTYTAWDCINFSPAKLKENESGALFILYQLLEGMQRIQDCGLFLGDVSLHHLSLGSDFYLTLIPHITDSLLRPDEVVFDPKKVSANATNKGGLKWKNNSASFLSLLSSPEAKSIISQFPANITSLESLQKNSLLHLTQKWVVHEISNFDYLLCLSFFAGHSFDSPVFYPTLPWVTDFTSPNGGWRDLTKSKYRLNKGDQQLDHTYQLAETGSQLDQIAHHIPEFFSEVTYYVYKARVTPKEILKRHVRQHFVASHYPPTIARMYTLTPEECIPEFYCDPTVFHSIHDDLPDLEVPPWCEDVNDFLRLHQGALESNYVSRRLHHWIDLYYGYKLTGSASVKAKNVCLPLVDDHASLSKGGIVQLFSIPHPPKLAPSPFLSRSPPLPHNPDVKEQASHKGVPKKGSVCNDSGETLAREEEVGRKEQSVHPNQSRSSLEDKTSSSCSIELPINYNPLTALNQVEMLYNFFLKTSGRLPDKLTKSGSSLSAVKQAAHRRRVRDNQVLGCLILQIFCPAKCRILSPNSSLHDMSSLAVRILRESNDIPKYLHHSLNIIFQKGGSDNINPREFREERTLPFQFSAVTEEGLPPPSPHQMLQPLINIISFPIYFSKLSVFVKRMKAFAKFLKEEVVSVVEEGKAFESFEDPAVATSLAAAIEQRVRRTYKDLQELVPHMPPEGLKLVLPYVIQLYDNPATAVSAAWHLTDLLAQALGPPDTHKHLLPLILKLFEMDSVSSNAHFKLFHHTFLLQLIVRLGLKTFLKHFIPPIIEGAGGYKAPLDSASNPAQTDEKQSQILRNEPHRFGMDDQSQASEDDIRLRSNYESGDPNFVKRRGSSIRSPSGAEADITDVENDTEIFVFEGGEDEDTLNEVGITGNMEMTDPVKSPVSDTVSLDEASLQDGGGSLPSLCPSRSPILSGDEELLSPEESSPTHHEVPSSVYAIPLAPSKLLGLSPKEPLVSTSLPDKALVPRPDDGTGEDFNEAKPYRNPGVITPCMDTYTDMSLAEVCCEDILWLAHRLGPVLTAKHLTRNLLRMLSLCYLPESGALTPQCPKYANSFSVTKKEVLGDKGAATILHCLSEIPNLYGEQVILVQYLSHVTELVSWCGSKLTTSQEAGLIGAMTLLQRLLIKLSDVTFMDHLQETLIRNTVYPVIRLLSSVKVSFSNGVAVRSILAWRVIDALCIMVCRVGREMSKEKLIPAITRFLTAFDKAHSSKFRSTQDHAKKHEDEDSETKRKSFDSQDNKERAVAELKKVFTPEMAYLSYVPLCRYLGAKCMEDSLPNHDLLRSLCLQYDEANQADYAAALRLDAQTELRLQFSSNSGAANVAVTGNRIDIKDPSDNPDGPSGDNSPTLDIESSFSFAKHAGVRMENTQRHLRGNWLAYWEHEIGRSEQERSFNFKQIKLQTFVGHSNSVKSVHVLDNENSFISCSKDKTVKLWSLQSQGDGTAECTAQWTYTNHKKSVFDVAFSESLRLAASCDSTVHIWDPFAGVCLKQLDSLRHSPVTVLTAMSPPSTQLVTATTDSTLKFIDLRTCNYTHELKITTSSVGLVRCLSTSDDSHLVAAAHSSGVIATLDLRTGQLLATWKPHEGEVLTLQWYKKGTFISSALDQTVCVWSVYDNSRKYLLKGPTEPVHLLRMFGDEVLTGTTANRIGVHSCASPHASFSCTRLRTEAFRGVLTAMQILPLNRQLLLGADNGAIRLLC